MSRQAAESLPEGAFWRYAHDKTGREVDVDCVNHARQQVVSLNLGACRASRSREARLSALPAPVPDLGQILCELTDVGFVLC